MAARVHDVREWFLLDEADKRARAMPEDVRAPLSRDVRIAKQKREAAEVLWVGGAPAEALALARDAFETQARLATREGDPKPSEQDLARLEATRKMLVERAVPELDEGVTATHTELFFALVDVHDRLHRLRAPLADSPAEVAKKRVRRIAFTALSAVATIVALYFILRTPRVVKAEASAVYSDHYAPAKALDGKPESEWLLPDNTLGWIDLHVSPPRRVNHLKLLNVHNGPYNDRATRDFHVEAYAGSTLLKSYDGTFPEFTETPAWVTVDLGVDKCDRIRIEVKSFHKSGGGFADLEID